MHWTETAACVLLVWGGIVLGGMVPGATDPHAALFQGLVMVGAGGFVLSRRSPGTKED